MSNQKIDEYCPHSFEEGEKYFSINCWDGRSTQWFYTVVKKTKNFITVRRDKETRHKIRYNDKNDEWIRLGNYSGAMGLYAKNRID